jgi:hypothetical protein
MWLSIILGPVTTTYECRVRETGKYRLRERG